MATTKITAPTGETGRTTRGSRYLLCTVAPADPGYAEGDIVYQRPKPARVIVLKGTSVDGGKALIRKARRGRDFVYDQVAETIIHHVPAEAPCAATHPVTGAPCIMGTHTDKVTHRTGKSQGYEAF